ncbi:MULTISPECIES: EamA family transporter RarD [Sorangium]|uniref:Membrane protein n=1 Tax=Sorangium cellulosum TaxID=56 RepID=A0A4P2QMS4_SORCE|nr:MULTISPECIES: EamA family transporter RarD [Sorangium]AUX30813.1 membrane protein [Sorangium cellulosum]WCQ90194.1 Protein RarD [Sorangium sp. Soce836]
MPTPDNPRDSRREAALGVVYGVAAYSAWGVVPVFWKQLRHVGAVEILAHRTVWSLLAFAALTLVTGQLRALGAALRDRRVVGAMAATGALVSANWVLFIYAVSVGRVLDASLGYFINPLLSVLLGMVFLRERLRPAQWIALGLAAAGVVHLAVRAGAVPWIALALAGTFGVYGLLRKVVAVNSLPGSTLETLFIAPLGAAYLASLHARGAGAMGRVDLRTDLLLAATGIVTALPLVWFTNAARRLSLTTLGFLQYLAPSGQFLLAVLVYGEPFTATQAVSFACIWTGLAVFSADAALRARASSVARTSLGM